MPFIRIWGDSAHPLVLLLHAQGCHKGWWDWVGPVLAAEGYRVVAPDFRGHGEAPWSDRYPWRGYVSDLAALVPPDRPWAVVGHSMGGYVALELIGAGLKPAALAVADMKTGASQEELAAMRAVSERPGRNFPTLEEAVSRYKLAPPEHCVPADRLARVAAESFRQEPDETWAPRFDRRAMAIEPLRPLELAAMVDCPSLWVRGEHSQIMPEAPTQELAAAAGGQWLTLGGLYHHLPLEAPETFAQTVGSFLDRTGLKQR